LAPVLIVLALERASGAAFGACLVIAFLSDVFDGIIARRLNVATPLLRRLDSVADSFFYVAALFAGWYLHRGLLVGHLTALGVLIGLEMTRYAVDWKRFGREAAYHMWSSKLWGVALFAGFFAVLVWGAGGWPVSLAIDVGILADVEGLAISLILREWKNDVPTFVHALRIRRAGVEGSGEGFL
jgi:CDP-diacylglycerol--glycerol-3-phosphate 3-phosphatidyltransferase